MERKSKQLDSNPYSILYRAGMGMASSNSGHLLPTKTTIYLVNGEQGVHKATEVTRTKPISFLARALA